MNDAAVIGLAFATFCAGVTVFFVSRKRLKEQRYRGDKIDLVFAPIETLEIELADLTGQYQELQSQYKRKRNTLQVLENKISLYELSVGTIDKDPYVTSHTDKPLGLLEHELDSVQSQVKELVRAKLACECEMGDFLLNDSKAEAKKLVHREIKLRLRCLDNEFEMAKVLSDWNNINRLNERCKVAFEHINGLGKLMKTYIREPYLDLKLKELKLSYDIKVQTKMLKDDELEKRRVERDLEREERKLEAASIKARKEREVMEKLVAEELKKIKIASKEQLDLLDLHKRQLRQLQEKEARAISMAQITKAGFVYVISNPDSFGNGVYKIGMTRRLDPHDRVKELGDASVPELFEEHAFAYSEDAPHLEGYLHDCFNDDRVNLVNKRKEFFNVNLNSVIEAIEKYNRPIELTQLHPNK
jgi:hypothetical protein